jgi:hypothetical protein
MARQEILDQMVASIPQFNLPISPGTQLWVVSGITKYIGCPTCYRTWHFFNNFTTNEQLGALQTHTTDTFLFISHTMNEHLFKCHCNIFIGFRIIKEMPDSVATGTHCINTVTFSEHLLTIFVITFYCILFITHTHTNTHTHTLSFLSNYF